MTKNIEPRNCYTKPLARYKASLDQSGWSRHLGRRPTAPLKPSSYIVKALSATQHFQSVKAWSGSKVDSSISFPERIRHEPSPLPFQAMARAPSSVVTAPSTFVNSQVIFIRQAPPKHAKVETWQSYATFSSQYYSILFVSVG